MAHITVYSQLIFTKIVLENQYKHLKNWGGGGNKHPGQIFFHALRAVIP